VRLTAVRERQRLEILARSGDYGKIIKITTPFPVIAKDCAEKSARNIS
jgi:hypothetical protein